MRVLVWAFDYIVTPRYLDNSKKMVRERYLHIEVGELGDIALKRSKGSIVELALLNGPVAVLQSSCTVT